MNLKKIGKFIAERRKNVGLTQFELAEKLNISDRAVSKWETGRGMPDSLIMLRLCEVLEINVNELLSGEKLEMKDYNKKAEENLVELKRKNEKLARQLLGLEWVIGTGSSVAFLALLFVVATVEMPIFGRVILSVVAFVALIVGVTYCLMIEQKVGFYKCPKCGYKYVPSLRKVYFAAHLGRTRKMTCPKCGEKAWQKKVVGED